MKKILAALVLLSVVFSAVSVEESDSSTRFYSRNINPDRSEYHARPYLWFEQTLTASTDAVVISGNPEDLMSGDIICEGDVDMDVAHDGEWAHGGFDTNAHYWFTETCMPTPYTSISYNVPIYWSPTSYGVYAPRLQNCQDFEACWGSEGSFTTQSVDYIRRLDPYEAHNDQRGHVNVICQGDISYRRDGTQFSTAPVSGTSPAARSTYLSYGTHTISSNMAVDGCLEIVRYDPCPSAGYRIEEIFSRTAPSDGPEYYNSIGPASITLEVTDDAHIRCLAEIVSVEPSPIVLGEEESVAVDITIRNPACPSGYYCMPVVVSGVEVNDPFRWFRPLTPGAPPFVLEPGETGTYRGTLIAPADLSGAPETVLFTVQTNCANLDGSLATDCSGSNRPLEIPVEIPFDREDENETELNIIPLLPGNMTISTGNETPEIDLTTRVIGGPSNSGHSRFWLFSDEGGAFTLIDFGEWRVPILTDADWPHPYGTITCEEEMNYWMIMMVDFYDTTDESNEEDNTDYFVIHCRNTTETGPEDHYCEIEPPEYEGIPGESYEFDLYCDGSQDNCGSADDVGWDVTEYGTLEDYNDIWANVSVDEGLVVTTEYEEITVTATVDYGDEGEAVCTAQIIVPNTEVECIYYV